jgi:hypothetical protein
LGVILQKKFEKQTLGEKKKKFLNVQLCKNFAHFGEMKNAFLFLFFHINNTEFVRKSLFLFQNISDKITKILPKK